MIGRILNKFQIFVKCATIQNDDWMHNSIDLRRINFRNMEYYNENVTKQRNKLLNDEISLK